ncbi:hypothetical protein [Streptomyces albogriseolus]|uniref:hypothetical protein n=1 Tax=Streptomyces albogriseolus TaxID=1887 RepID=UPI003F4A680D
MDLHAWITQQVDHAERLIDENEFPPSQTEGVRLRCEADRRILARHKAWPGSDWCDHCDADLTTYLADCPELLDLAHAHGITPEILASLDRPTTPEQKLRPGRRLGLADILAPRTPMGEVPGALRGPNWKPRST